MSGFLGTLFEEDGGIEGSYTPPSSTSAGTKYGEKPPIPRNETKLSGLRNQGATCYLNVLIQTLLYTPEFREPLFNLTAKDLNLSANQIDSSQQSSSGTTLKVRKIIVELQRLFAEMLLLNQQACSSIRLTDSFGWQSNEAIDHQDVHELNRLLFDAIQKSLQGTRQSNLIRSCYEGSTNNYTQCKNCLKIFKRVEDYHDLPLVVQDSPNLHTSLANMFTIPESLVGDNRYRCSSCANQLCDAEKWAKISKLPPILTLPLQRFVYDVKTGNRQKKTSRFEFPFEMDLKEFCEDSLTETNYELFAVVIHRGTCYSGHYYVYIKDIDQIGTWTPPLETQSSSKSSNKKKDNNTSVAANNSTPTSGRTTRNSNSNEPVETEDETMNRLDSIKTILLSCDDWVTIDYLRKIYTENLLAKWSRSRNTTFTKFLRNHPEVFEINENRVRLVNQNCSMETDDNDIQPMDYECSQSETTVNHTTTNNVEHWFCFDDCSVTCVNRQQIEKHFGQSECAYMLFYRQKNLRATPMDCSDNSTYSIPSWLLDEISEKNRILEERREAYEKFENRLSITIYPGEWFEVVDDGRLNLNNNDQFLFPDLYGANVFDKRTKVNEFLAKLEETYGIGSHYYVAKKLRSGQLHVISELGTSNTDAALEKTDLLGHPHLIIFKSPTALPDTVLQGEEFEPIMLNILYGFPDAHVHAHRLKTIQHVAKNTTLQELKERLCRDYYQTENLPNMRQIRMCRLNLEEKNNRKSRREFKADEEKQTIAQLKLQEGETLGIDDKSSFVPNWKDMSSNSSQVGRNQFSLMVKNGLDSTLTQPMTYGCSNTTQIGEVKLMAIRAFDISLDPSLCRLYIDDDPDLSHTPLYDHLTVDTIEFKQNNTNLILKFGQALKENDLLLYILSDREPSPLELVIDRNRTLSELWAAIKTELRMDANDNEYHLCEVSPSLINEGSPLNDFDQSLTDNRLTNGAQLTMRAGSVAPKNHVRVRMTRIIDKYYQPADAIHTRPKYQMVDLEERFELALISPFNVLRERIANFIDFKVPSNYVRNNVKPLDFIRLYTIQDGEPSKIIRQPALTTLKQEKVEDLELFAFEILSHPECLEKKDLLLNIVYGKDDNNYFQHRFELHWPLKENILAKYEYLEQHVIARVTDFMSNDLQFKAVSKSSLKITMARYFPDRAQWLIIQSPSSSATSSSSQSGNKKNRGSNSSNNASKNNLRLEPYKINDLAVIGVLEGEYLGIEHFDTKFDQIKRRELEQDKEQKRVNRERNRTDNDRNQQNGSSGRRRSPQNAMRIDVDDFDN